METLAVLPRNGIRAARSTAIVAKCGRALMSPPPDTADRRAKEEEDSATVPDHGPGNETAKVPADMGLEVTRVVS